METGTGILDGIALIIWVLVFLTPFITIPLFWRNTEMRKIYRILLGLSAAVLLSIVLYYICVLIVFRDGMGP
jgi:uncharacterized protein YybS (DUF2232 family)